MTRTKLIAKILDCFDRDNVSDNIVNNILSQFINDSVWTSEKLQSYLEDTYYYEMCDNKYIEDFSEKEPENIDSI